MAFKHGFQDGDPHAGKYEIAAKVIRETSKAVLADDGTRQEWLPKSKITIEPDKGGAVAIYMPEWLAKRAGFA